ncbi:MAG: hypothetical protein WCF81_04370 [Roseiarcus sp.]
MLLLLAATPCRADCHVDHFNYFHGSEVPATMHVSSGAPCLMKFTNGGKSNIDSIAITRQASHGAASWNGSTAYPGVSYRSSPGYKGQDEFSFDISGASTRSPSPASVRVSVEVK